MTFSDKLKELRQTKDWTQPEAADAIGIEQSYLSKLENDKSIPSDEVFDQLLKGYGVTIDDLIGDLSSAECTKLSDIPAVNSYIVTLKGKAQQNSDRWNISAISCIVLGVGLIISGETSLFFSDTIYEYRAADNTHEREFHERHSYLQHLSKLNAEQMKPNTSYSPDSARTELAKMTFPPKPELYFQNSSDYLGEHFIGAEPNKDGSQREFRLVARTKINPSENKALLTFGLMLLTAGALVAALMRKWKS